MLTIKLAVAIRLTYCIERLTLYRHLVQSKFLDGGFSGRKGCNLMFCKFVCVYKKLDICIQILS